MITFDTSPLEYYRGKGKDPIRGTTNNDTSTWSFMLVKTITYEREEQYQRVIDALDNLTRENFSSIKVPSFAFCAEDRRIQYQVQYIKGGSIISREEWYTLYDELVERNSEYSFTDYKRKNFIKYHGCIYPVDLNSYSKTPIEVRRTLWKREEKMPKTLFNQQGEKIFY